MGSLQVLEQAIGTDRDYQLVLSDDAGNLATGYLSSDPVTCAVWPGDAVAPLATPTVVWTTAPTTLKLTIAATDIAALEVQPYPIRVMIAHGGRSILAWKGWLDLSASPGAGVALPVYAPFGRMLDYAGSWFKKLLLETSEAGFANERSRARTYLEAVILARYRPRQFGYHVDLSYGVSYLWYGDAPDPMLKGFLALNNLIVTPKVIEIVSRLAIAYVCLGDIGNAGQANPYLENGRENWAIAQGLIKGYVAEIDINGDGYTDIAINCGVVNTRSIY